MADKKKPVTHTKMSPEELAEYQKFRRRGSVVPAKKGKGTRYNRQKSKKGGVSYDKYSD